MNDVGDSSSLRHKNMFRYGLDLIAGGRLPEKRKFRLILDYRFARWLFISWGSKSYCYPVPGFFPNWWMGVRFRHVFRVRAGAWGFLHLDEANRFNRFMLNGRLRLLFFWGVFDSVWC